MESTIANDLVLEKINELVVQGKEHAAFITDLRIHQNTEAVAVDNLAKQVGRLSENISEMRDVMNKGRGALWGLGAAAASAGGLVSYITHKFLGAG